MGTLKVNGDISATGTISASSFLGNASSSTYTHQWRTTAENPCTTSTDSSTGIFNVPDSRVYWISKTGTVIDQLNQWGYILDIGNNAERHQIWMTQSSGDMAHRGGNSNGWSGSWRVLLDSINYTSYTVTKTGSGASGTWGINITGNAATATTASAVAWGNVTGKPSTFTPSSHNHTSLTGITSLDFSAHSDDGATIKTTIDNASTYLDFNLVDDGESDLFRWNFGRWDSATSSQKNVTLMTLTCAQNANSAKLVVNGTIQGNLDWNYITNKPSTFTPSSHNHSSLSRLIVDDSVSYSMVGSDSSGGSTYEKALLSTLCQRYPGYDGNFAGRYWPNAYGFLLGNIYNTSTTSGGLPQYSTFIGCNLSEAPRIFGTYNYNQYAYSLLTSNNYSSYALPLSGGAMSGNIIIGSNFITGETGSAQVKCHGLQIGYPNHDYWTFSEWGGLYHFYKYQTSGSTVTVNTLCGSINEYGWVQGPGGYGSTFPSSPATGQVFYKT